jgi:monoterpene epsilon-lactone hydrolase
MASAATNRFYLAPLFRRVPERFESICRIVRYLSEQERMQHCSLTRLRVIALAILMLAFTAATSTPPAWSQSDEVRTIPQRSLPTPSTVSPEMQKAIAPSWTGDTGTQVVTRQQWKASIEEDDEREAKRVDPLLQQFHVTLAHQTIAGVQVYVVKPAQIAPENRDRLLVHVHGGGYVSFAGRAATPEAILMAHYGQIEVISVDYRMPPDFPFPAAVDDAVAVWKAVIHSHGPSRVGLFGTSAGGGLTLATVLRLKELRLPLPGALMAGTPWTDLTQTGDSYFTNEFVDNVLGSYRGGLEADAKLYAGTHDLKEALLSPIYGDVSGFPPTLLLSGTRDLFLSNTVRMHQKLLQSGVRAELLVFEGQAHAQYLIVDDAPESATAWREVSRFFNQNLGK